MNTTLLGLLLAVSLGTLIVAEVQNPLPDGWPVLDSITKTTLPAPRGATPAAAISPVTPWTAPDIDTLLATRERPLFFENREYPAEPTEVPTTEAKAASTPPSPTVPLGEVRLSAVLEIGDEPVALVRDGAAGIRHLRVGDDLESGWTLKTIAGESVTFSRGSSEEVVKLWDFSAKPPATTRRAPNARATAGANRSTATRVQTAERRRALGTARARALEAARARTGRGAATASQPQLAVPRTQPVPRAALPSANAALGNRSGSSQRGECGLSRC